MREFLANREKKVQTGLNLQQGKQRAAVGQSV
jgi:hypothetical protein